MYDMSDSVCIKRDGAERQRVKKEKGKEKMQLGQSLSLELIQTEERPWGCNKARSASCGQRKI